MTMTSIIWSVPLPTLVSCPRRFRGHRPSLLLRTWTGDALAKLDNAVTAYGSGNAGIYPSEGLRPDVFMADVALPSEI